MNSDARNRLFERCHSMAQYASKHPSFERTTFSFLVQAYRQLAGKHKADARRVKALAEVYLPDMFTLYKSEFRASGTVVSVSESDVLIEKVNTDATRTDMARRARLRSENILDNA